MADPVIVPAPADEWTIVATAVSIGNLHLLKPGVPTMYTYRLTGEDAPTLPAEGVKLDRSNPIHDASAIDIYVWPVGAAQSVRVDV
jgi:hypothetical protein